MSNRRGEKKNPDGQEVKALGQGRINLTTGVSKQAYVLIKRHRPKELSIPISDIHTVINHQGKKRKYFLTPAGEIFF